MNQDVSVSVIHLENLSLMIERVWLGRLNDYFSLL